MSIRKSSGSGQINFPGGAILKQDSSGNPGFFDSSGTELCYLDLGQGVWTWLVNKAVTTFTKDWIGNETTAIAIAAKTGHTINLGVNGSDMLIINQAGTIGVGFPKMMTVYNNIFTAGIGIPPIYAAGAQTLYTNAAPTTLTYTPPSTAGVYRLSGGLNILTGGTLTFKVKVTYKDPGGNAITDIPVFTQQNSATLLAGGPTANTTGRFFFSMIFPIDNSATAITIADNVGTYTAGTYYWTPILEQLA